MSDPFEHLDDRERDGPVARLLARSRQRRNDT